MNWQNATAIFAVGFAAGFACGLLALFGGVLAFSRRWSRS